MAIKFSQFNLRTNSTATMHLVGYDGNQNIHITVDNLINDFIDGTENTIAMFGPGGNNVIDSAIAQQTILGGDKLLTVQGFLNVDKDVTIDRDLEVTRNTTLNGNVILGNASTDLITQTGTLYLNGPVKDTTDTLGEEDQILVSDATGELNFQDLLATHVESAEVVKVPVKNLEGSPLTKGDPVYISGSVGASGRLEIKLADASNAAKMPAVGLLSQNLGINEEGFVVITGKLRNLPTDPIDGQPSSANDVIYVKGGGVTGAALTLTKPTGTDLIQNMGKVGRASTSNDGTFVVSSILRTNDIPNLTPGKIWVGSTGNTIESSSITFTEATGAVQLNEYGINAITGTATYNLSVDASGNVIETAIPGTYTFDISDGTTTDTISSGDTVQFDGENGITVEVSPTPLTDYIRISHDDITRADTGSTESPGYGGTFTAVDSISTNTQGHLTAVNLKTVTMPSAITNPVTGTGVATRVAFWDTASSLSSSADLYWDNTNGRLGIGTALPKAKLDVDGNFRINTNNLELSSTPAWGVPTQNIIAADDNTNGATLTLMNTNATIPAGGASGTLQFVALDDGRNNGGAGYATASISTVSTSAPGMGTSGQGNLIFKTSAGFGTVLERMRVNSSGVGIGTTSPGEKLEVSGNIKTTTATITEGSTVTFSGGGATYETLGTNVAFARGTGGGAMYNPLLNPGGWTYAGRLQAPIGLLFNVDGWTDLTNIQQRNYLGFVEVLGSSVGNNILYREMIMWDYLNDNYYKLKFTAWGQMGAGGYTYQRTPLTINNERSVVTNSITTDELTVGKEIALQSGIKLYSRPVASNTAPARWAELLADPGASTIKILSSTTDPNDDKVTEQENIRIGHRVGANSGSGTKKLAYNVLIGAGVASGSSNVNSQVWGNVFMGYSAGNKAGTTANNSFYNVGIGWYALNATTEGDDNVAVGHNAGQYVSSGDNNVFLGASAGNNTTTGDNNIAIGFLAQPASGTTSNTITLGNSSITTLRCQVTSITALSDKRDKANIKQSTYGLNVINKLNPVTFDWNMRDGGKVGDKDLGFIAQELQEVDDENLNLVYDENPDKLEATYGRLIPVMTKAIQELSEKIEKLESRIQTLENQ